MSGSPPPHRVQAEHEAAKAETASAAMVVQALVKAERGFAIYLPNNPLHEKFFEDFRRRLEEHLDQFGPLRFDLAHDRILSLGEAVYVNEERRENIAFRMFADGLRTLVIDVGIEPREARALVEAVRQPATDAEEDDVVTRLWSADLRHVRYELAEIRIADAGGLLSAGGAAGGGAGGLRGVGIAGGAAGPGVRGAQEGMITRFAAELAAVPPALPPAPRLSPQVFSLDESEIAALQDLVAAERCRMPLEDMAGILEAIIAAETEMPLLEEFLGIVTRLCGDLLLTGRVGHAVKLLGVLVRVAARPGVPPERAAAIGDARRRIISAEVLEGLTRLLVGGDTVDREDLRTLVTLLGSAAIEPFCRILGDVTIKETRRVLIDALAEIGRDSPGLFLPFLGDPRWYLVRNTIYILRRIANPEVARAVRRCAVHKDPRVRKEVLLYLEETGDATAEPLLLSFLADEVSALRVAAARGLARRGSVAAAERLLTVAGAGGFPERDRAEREAVWEAIAEIAPDRALPRLREMLFKRQWFGQAREIEDTACAAAGLRRIGTPEALGLLRQAAAAKRGRAREIVERALRTPAPVSGESERGGSPRAAGGAGP